MRLWFYIDMRKLVSWLTICGMRCTDYQQVLHGWSPFAAFVVLSLHFNLCHTCVVSVWFPDSCFEQTVRTRRRSLCRVTRTAWPYCAPLCTSTRSLPSSLSGAGSVKVSKVALALSPRPSTSAAGRISRAHWPIWRSQANRPQWHGPWSWIVWRTGSALVVLQVCAFIFF